MDLAKKFRSILGEKSEHDSIIYALSEVNQLFSEKLKPNTQEEECIRFFFNKSDTLHPNKNYFNIMECWSVMEPYIWNLPSKELRKFWVIQIIQEQESVRQVMQYNEILDSEVKEHLDILKKMVDSIEDLFHKKYMVEIIREKGRCSVRAIYPLYYFDEQCYHPYRDFLIQKLYYLLSNKGKVVVVAGSNGLTPQRFFEYNMCNFKCRMKKVNPMSYDQNSEEYNRAIRNGLMNGYVYDELWK